MLSYSKPIEASFSTISIDLLCLQHAQMHTSQDTVFFMRQTDDKWTKPITLSLAHVHGVKIIMRDKK